VRGYCVSLSPNSSSVLKWYPRTARGAKIDLASHVFASYGDRFEVVGINDVSTDDISQYLDGVTAVIHTAAPLSNRGDAKFILKVVIHNPPLLQAVLNLIFCPIGSH